MVTESGTKQDKVMEHNSLPCLNLLEVTPGGLDLAANPASAESWDGARRVVIDRDGVVRYDGALDDDPRGQVLADLTAAIARATTQGNLRLAEAPQDGSATTPEAMSAQVAQSDPAPPSSTS